jgi:hypothetical protein
MFLGIKIVFLEMALASTIFPERFQNWKLLYNRRPSREVISRKNFFGNDLSRGINMRGIEFDIYKIPRTQERLYIDAKIRKNNIFGLKTTLFLYPYYVLT